MSQVCCGLTVERQDLQEDLANETMTRSPDAIEANDCMDRSEDGTGVSIVAYRLTRSANDDVAR